MKKILYCSLLMICSVFALCDCPTSGCAHKTGQTTFQNKDASIRIEDASFSILNGASNGAAYCTIHAHENDELIEAHYLGDGIKTIELHTHIIDAKGTAKMRPVHSFKIQKNVPFALKTGGDHIMLMGIKDGAFKNKETIDLVLEFQSGKKITVTFKKKKQAHSCCGSH